MPSELFGFFRIVRRTLGIDILGFDVDLYIIGRLVLLAPAQAIIIVVCSSLLD